jgi:hypothetical protein
MEARSAVPLAAVAESGVSRHPSFLEHDLPRTFRYPGLLVQLLRGTALALPLIGAVEFWGRIEGAPFVLIWTVLAGAWTGAAAWLWWRARGYAVELDACGLTVRTSHGSTRVQYAAVRELEIRWPVGGVGGLELIGPEGRRLARVSGAVQHFGRLVMMVRRRCAPRTWVRERFADGQWSDGPAGPLVERKAEPD